MAAADTQDRTTAPLLPPDEKFWTRYSPHFELPLAGATSLLLHGVVLGVLLLGGLAFLLRGSIEASKPPSMDVVQLEGEEGDGGPSGGGIVGDPDGGGAKTEVTATEPPMPTAQAAPNTPTPAPPVEDPTISDSLPESTDVTTDLDDIIKAAKVQATKPPETKPVAEARAAPAKAPGGDGRKPGPKGTGGLGSTGSGTGLGKGTGPGTGTGGIPGARKATQQEIYAYRWRFDLSGDGKQHADKLAKVGFILALPDPSGGYLLVSDITRRPAEVRKNNLAAYKGAVKLENRVPESIRKLAEELRLPFVPPVLILMLPKDREEKMAVEEARFARAHQRDMRTVRETWFDFRLVDGEYEPIAISQR